MQNTGLLTATFILAGTFNVIFPFVLGWWIIKKKRTNWKLFGVGVLTFVGSQIFHIPLVNGLTRAFSSGLLPHVSPGFAPFFNAIVLGLLAGIFEETARWIGYKLLKKQGDSLGAALTLGAGHGGIEAISIGFIVLFNLVGMISMRSLGIDNLPVAADQLAQAQAQLQAYWSQPWFVPFLGAIERIGALAMHISLSILVWMAFSFRRPIWFWIAVLYHALLDGAVVLATSFGVNAWLLELVFIIVSFSGLALIWRYARMKDDHRSATIESQALAE